MVLGASVGLGSLLWHSQWWGLALAAAATAATTVLLPPGARAGFVVGWWLPVVRGAVPTDAGDLLVMGDLNGYLLLLGGFTLAVAVMVSAPGARTRPRGSDDTGILGRSA